MIQIFGKGGFAREVAAYYEWANPYNKIEFFENEEIKNASFKDDVYTLIAIGDVKVRKKIAQENPNHNYAIYVDGNVCPIDSLNLDNNFFTKHNKIGKGTIICHGTLLTTGITIGEHVIINLNCTIGHDCKIGNFVTISPGANISGNVEIGDECYIGTNAVIREKIKICSGVTIGAGAVVVKDITEPGVYVGSPAKKVEKNEKTITREATNEEIIYALNDSNAFKFTSGALNVLKAVLNRHGISFTKTTNQ